MRACARPQRTLSAAAAAGSAARAAVTTSRTRPSFPSLTARPRRPAAAVLNPYRIGSSRNADGNRRHHCRTALAHACHASSPRWRHSPDPAVTMGKKPRASCGACGAAFKQKSATDKGGAGFCNVTCAAAGYSASAGGSGDYSHYDVPPAFAGAATGYRGGGGNNTSDRGYGSDYSGRACHALVELSTS